MFVLKFVVKFLSLKDKAKCQFVCRQWKDIVDDEFRLYQFCISSWKNDFEHYEIYKSYPSLRINDFEKQHEIYKYSPMAYIGPVIDEAVNSKDYNKLDAILSRFPSLKCIYLDFLYNDTIRNESLNRLDKSIQCFFKSKCPKLTYICMHNEEKYKSEIANFEFSNLNSLYVRIGRRCGTKNSTRRPNSNRVFRNLTCFFGLKYKSGI